MSVRTPEQKMVASYTCWSCVNYLIEWKNGTQMSLLPFSVPWRHSKQHGKICYIYHVNIQGITVMTRAKLQYLDIPPEVRSVPHIDELSGSVSLVDHKQISDSDSMLMMSIKLNIRWVNWCRLTRKFFKIPIEIYICQQKRQGPWDENCRKETWWNLASALQSLLIFINNIHHFS